MSEVIDDLIVLGTAVPQHLNNGRTTVCLGGWSPTKGFIRIYPTKADMKLRRWNVISVEAERNKQDTRQESWKIVGSKEEWDNLYERIEIVGRIEDAYERRQIVINQLSPCVDTLNDAHISLGLVQVKYTHHTYFGTNPQYGEPIQTALFSTHAQEWAKVKRDYKQVPRLKYSCSSCQTKQGFHDQTILDWGFYEWMRKNPDKLDQVWVNVGFLSDKHEIFLFVGNQENQRSSYVIISVISIQKDPKPPKPKQPTLF